MSGTALCTRDQFGMKGVPIGSFRNPSPASMIFEETKTQDETVTLKPTDSHDQTKPTILALTASGP